MIMRHEFRNLMLCPYSRGTTFKRDILGSAIGATAQHISDAINYFNVKNTNQTNKDIAEANNNLSLQLARENNNLQKILNYDNNAFAAREAEKAWQRQIEWNNPVNQISMLKAAGINPAVYFGAHGQATGSAAAAAAAPHGSGISTSMPSLQQAHMIPWQMSSPSEAFKNMAEGFAKLADSRKSNEEARRLDKTFNKFVEGFTADVEMKKNVAFLQSAFGFVKENLVVAKMKNELAQGTEIVNNLKSEGKFKEAQIALTRSQQRAQEAASKLSDKQREQVDEQIRAYGSIVQAQINESQARANQANSQARFTEQQRQDLADMHEYNVGVRRNQYQMSQAEVMKVGATLYSEIDYLLGHFETLTETERAQLEAVKIAAQRAKFEYDMRWVNWGLDTVERINNGANKWAPWAFSRTDSSHTESYETNDGTRVSSQTHEVGYRPAWKK